MEQFSHAALDDSSLGLCEQQQPSWPTDEHTARKGDYRVLN